MKETYTDKAIPLRRICLTAVAVYCLLVILLYVLGGYQLHYQPSRGNLQMPAAQSAVAELIDGAVIEQRFTADIQRIQSVSVLWGTYYRQNSGTVTMELLDETGQALLAQSFDAAAIQENGVLSLCAEAPLEGLAGKILTLRLTANSRVGAAVAPMMNSGSAQSGGELLLEGQPVAGTLCFSVSGEDYTWLGLHYWISAAILGLLIVAYFVFVLRKDAAGQPTIFTALLSAMYHYRFLIKQLVDRDFKTKYKRSILGVFWSFLNPLLTMIVQYVVFSNIFRQNIDYFPVYLLCGNIVFSYFSEACGMSLTSIVGNSALITKVYIPKYIYPLTRIISSLINVLISMIPMFVAAWLCGLFPTKVYLLLPFPLVCLAAFCLGLGMFLAAAMVFFRDVQFLWGIVTMLWMYLTPIFYRVDALPVQVQAVVRLNPLYAFITFIRTCVIEGISPAPVLYLQCLLSAGCMLLIGVIVFKKTQDSFVLYL